MMDEALRKKLDIGMTRTLEEIEESTRVPLYGSRLYKILSATFMDKLEEEVITYMNQGWKPLGGIAISPTYVYLQAMILELK